MSNPSELLPVSSSSLTFSRPTGSLTDNTAILLQGLMASWDWRDLRAEVVSAEEQEQARAQRFNTSVQRYLTHQDVSSRAQFIEVLEDMRAQGKRSSNPILAKLCSSLII